MNAVTKILFAALAAVLIASSAANSCPKYRFRVFTDTASHARGLNHIVHNYRNALGHDNGSKLGPIKRGRREINWDAPQVPFNMPFDFFNTNVPRGAVFSAKGNKFAVSNSKRHPVDDRFSSLLPRGVAHRFQRFSLERLFTPVKDNLMTVHFQVPGKKIRARVSGFGSVFTDVVDKRATSLRYYDSKGCLIAHVVVPAKSRGLSFAGIIVFDHAGKQIDVIAKVVIKLGTISVADFHNRGDVVVMDDFIYGEPQQH